MKRIYKTVAGMLSAVVLSLLALIIYAQVSLPDSLYITQGEDIYSNTRFPILSLGNTSFSATGLGNCDSGNYHLDLRLFDRVPIKQVSVEVVPRNMVIPSGEPFGIKMFTQGIMVVGMSDIQNGSESLSPAKDAGLKVGDLLLSINDIPLYRNEDVARYIATSGGEEVKMTVSRNEQEMDLYLYPVFSEFDEAYKVGIWVRDSSAGIGTMTYYNPDTLVFAGLGHAICDVDTGEIMPLSSGEIVNVNITGVNTGHSGKPGELRGTFIGGESIGELLINSENGVYGYLTQTTDLADPVPVAMKQEIKTGPATILSTISGNKPQKFDIMIERINYSEGNTTKNMVIRVTDEYLLTTTGGIVQGMSGSPIIQDGKLVGAVTHVFVNDPTRGYGIFAENMEKTLKNFETTQMSA